MDACVHVYVTHILIYVIGMCKYITIRDENRDGKAGSLSVVGIISFLGNKVTEQTPGKSCEVRLVSIYEKRLLEEDNGNCKVPEVELCLS